MITPSQTPEAKRAWLQRYRQEQPERFRAYRAKHTPAWRQRHPELNRAYQQAAQANYRARHPDRVKARSAFHRALKRGEIQRQPCQICGTNEQIQAHHETYARPLRVTWVCAQHHHELHRGAKRGNRTHEAR